MSKRAYVFVNGNYEKLDFLKKLIHPDDILVGCDGGSDSIYKLEMKPQIVVGDFDSIKFIPDVVREAPADSSSLDVDGVIYQKWPRDKDFLDTELAIDAAVSAEAGEIRLVGIAGDELDHMIGTLFMLGKTKYSQVNLKIITPNQTISCQAGAIKITGSIGQKVSLIPMFGPVEVLKSSGLKYDPAKYKMQMEDNSGISNELIKTVAEIEVTKGAFLVVEHQRVVE